MSQYHSASTIKLLYNNNLSSSNALDYKYLMKFRKFERTPNAGFRTEEIALSTAVRVMLEEHAFW
jgi:hypothetical protein